MLKKYIITLLPVFLGFLSTNVSAADDIYKACKAKWQKDYEMVEYCVKKQEKAKRNLDDRDRKANGGHSSGVVGGKRRY